MSYFVYIYEDRNSELKVSMTEDLKSITDSKLLWYGETTDERKALIKEGQLKRGKKSFLHDLVKDRNPEYKDLKSNV